MAKDQQLHPQSRARQGARHDNRSTWKQSPSKTPVVKEEKEVVELEFSVKEIAANAVTKRDATAEPASDATSNQWRDPWSFSLITVASLVAAAGLILCIWQSFTTTQLDPKGAAMSYMASGFVRFPDFDTEHTRFATKYSLHLYKELGIDDDDERVGHAQEPRTE
jgi:hypothetical protein